jgi:hypothetical protein
VPLIISKQEVLIIFILEYALIPPGWCAGSADLAPFGFTTFREPET